MRILGIDFGDKKVGLAVSDPLGITAQGLTVIRYEGERALIEQLKEIVKQNSVSKIVMGFPKNMNGTIGPRGEKTLGFAEKLKENFEGIPVILWDERLTTSAAKRVMVETGVKRKNKEKMEDKIAAVLILQTYLESI